jgi:hypothetical protein
MTTFDEFWHSYGREMRDRITEARERGASHLKITHRETAERAWHTAEVNVQTRETNLRAEILGSRDALLAEMQKENEDLRMALGRMEVHERELGHPQQGPRGAAALIMEMAAEIRELRGRVQEQDRDISRLHNAMPKPLEEMEAQMTATECMNRRARAMPELAMAYGGGGGSSRRGRMFFYDEAWAYGGGGGGRAQGSNVSPENLPRLNEPVWSEKLGCWIQTDPVEEKVSEKMREQGEKPEIVDRWVMDFRRFCLDDVYPARRQGKSLFANMRDFHEKVRTAVAEVEEQSVRLTTIAADSVQMGGMFGGEPRD